MKITVKQDLSVEETEITIVCNQIDGQIQDIISKLSFIDDTVVGKRNRETYFIPLKDILYFESVDNNVFLYTEQDCYETETRLYMLEERLKNTSFLRVSKSVIVNLKKMKSIKPETNRRLCATLSNGERILISRQYIDDIKERLGI